MTSPIPSADDDPPCECAGDIVTSPTCPRHGVWLGDLGRDRRRTEQPLGVVVAAMVPELQVKRIAR